MSPLSSHSMIHQEKVEIQLCQVMCVFSFSLKNFHVCPVSPQCGMDQKKVNTVMSSDVCFQPLSLKNSCLSSLSTLYDGSQKG